MLFEGEAVIHPGVAAGFERTKTTGELNCFESVAEATNLFTKAEHEKDKCISCGKTFDHLGAMISHTARAHKRLPKYTKHN